MMTAGPAYGGQLLAVRDLKVHFPIPSGLLQRATGVVKAVDGVTLEIDQGDTFGLVGESGCGKSTTGRAILRLVRPTSGDIDFAGVDLMRVRSGELRRLRRRLQIVFQDPYSSLSPRMKVGEILSEPIKLHELAEGTARERRVGELLDLVGLGKGFKDRYPHELSGGQRQRVGIARALAVEPDFVVCDEPISALDVSIQAQILNLLVDLRRQLGLTYLFIAHDLAVVRRMSTRVGVMYLGNLVEVGKSSIVYRHPAHPYTRALLSAVPLPDPKVERRRTRITLAGDVPSPASSPAGCRFHTRCYFYERLGRPEACVTTPPQLQLVSTGQQAACHFAEEFLANGQFTMGSGHSSTADLNST